MTREGGEIDVVTAEFLQQDDETHASKGLTTLICGAVASWIVLGGIVAMVLR